MKHLIISLLLLLSVTAASALSEPVTIGNARITFITDGLVRLEWAEDAKFLDDSTLFAVDRTPREVDVNFDRKGRDWTFRTPVFTLHYNADGCPFGEQNTRATWRQDGRECSWNITYDNANNLGGQLSTPMAFDNVSTRVPLLQGLLSRDGWHVINDSSKDVYRNGRLEYRHPEHVQDIYLFVYGTDYEAAMQSLAAVSGKVPMPRRSVLGAWYCRYWSYTADDYRQIVQGYADHDFPLDIMVFDMDWHRQNADRGMGHGWRRGWTGYSWNHDLIPDPAGLIGEFADKGISVVLNDHPHDGLLPYEDRYGAFTAELGIDTATMAHPIFSANDPAYMKAFFRHAHGPSDSIGVAFWWLDWQQDYAFPIVRGSTTKHLPWVNELWYNASRRPGLRPQGFSRWGGWGDHRHPIQFTGDIFARWDMLDFEVEMSVAAGNCGSFFCAHDIGGFYERGTPELYTRWTQFGLLSAAMRIHSFLGDDMDRRPWLWGEHAEAAMRRAYHLRSQLMPYIYTSVRQCHDRTVPLLRGLYFAQPDSAESYKHPTEYMFGDLILAAPVTEPSPDSTGTVAKTVFFPAGNVWYSLFTGRSYEGGSTATVDVPLDESPVFVKGGYPLPMQPYTQRMTSEPLDELVVRCYPGTAGEYTLYEDDGISETYLDGAFARTPMSYERQGKRIRLAIGASEGSYDGQPLRRAYTLELPGVAAGAKVKVDGRRAKALTDDALGGIVVKVPARDIRRPLVVDIIEQ